MKKLKTVFVVIILVTLIAGLYFKSLSDGGKD